jgi:hypothetical protein
MREQERPGQSKCEQFFLHGQPPSLASARRLEVENRAEAAHRLFHCGEPGWRRGSQTAVDQWSASPGAAAAAVCFGFSEMRASALTPRRLPAWPKTELEFGEVSARGCPQFFCRPIIP